MPENLSGHDRSAIRALAAASQIASSNKRAAIHIPRLQTIADATRRNLCTESEAQSAAKAGPPQTLRTTPSTRVGRFPSTIHQSRCDVSSRARYVLSLLVAAGDSESVDLH